MRTQRHLSIVLLAAALLGCGRDVGVTQSNLQTDMVVQAPPAQVFALINDFHQWPRWWQLERIDPAMERSFSGPASGVGAVHGWLGNAEVGQGRMQIVETVPDQRVRIDLDLLGASTTHAVQTFDLSPQGTGTRVTVQLASGTPDINKLLHLFLSLQKTTGKDFEAALATQQASAQH